jgi:hydrogenase small subunit
VSNLQMLRETLEGAALVIAVGTCASFGGLPAAAPNPSTAAGVQSLMSQGLVPTRPLINVSGCPPVPEVISGTIAYYLVFGTLPELDDQRRPKVYFGKTVHDCCTRLSHFNAGRFALSFDDEGARRGYCLMMLGCKGPDTRNACSSVRWNERTSFPMHSGHGCLGCSQPQFWDRPGGFYGVIEKANKGNPSNCAAPAQPQLP